jgi:hypothetical protein
VDLARFTVICMGCFILRLEAPETVRVALVHETCVPTLARCAPRNAAISWRVDLACMGPGICMILTLRSET